MAHPCHPRPGCTDRTIASPEPSIFCRTRECPSAGNEDPSPPTNGTGLLIKEEPGELLDQRFHVLSSTQELRQSTRKFAKLVGDYLGEERPICLSMGTWLRHIDSFKRKYDKAFAKDPLFGVYFMDHTHKHVQVFLHSCNTTAI